MPAMTPTKKKPRWQAWAVAALVLVGAIAVPQAADAASKTRTCGDWWATTCSTTVVATKSLTFRAWSTGPNARVSYTVKANSGRTLCRGTLTFDVTTVRCSLGSYRGPVVVKVDKIWGSTASIRVSY